MLNSIKLRIAALALGATLAANAQATDVTGAGASFIFPVMTKWSADYAKASGNKVNYQSIGSGGGIAQIKAGTVDFGSSDAPLPPDELAAAGLAQFPSAIGGVVPVVTLAGVAPGQLRLTGPVLADIFLGKLTKWNDPAIAALNPELKLPEQRITVVHRSDGSGTTEITVPGPNLRDGDPSSYLGRAIIVHEKVDDGSGEVDDADPDRPRTRTTAPAGARPRPRKPSGARTRPRANPPDPRAPEEPAP